MYNCSVYDAAYLALAEERKEPFITADERLYYAVSGHLGQVIWVRDYTCDEEKL